MLISYNWLKSYIPQIPDVDKVTNLITFHLCEIESVDKLPSGDTVFDLKILPDRAHDLLSHQGVAREVASLLGVEFKLPDYKLPESKQTNLKIEIETPKCRRYMGRIIRNIKIGPSPDWMVKYLESVGQRSINNIIDATNILVFDCGQPIHAFDLDKLSNSRIVVKNANEGDILELVGSEKLKASLKDADMMITDGVKNLAIAGVKGGLDSGVSDNTVNLLIEVANFDAVSVRKTARRLGIQTDASKRYENNLSPTLCDLAMKEITSLIFEMCPDASFEEVIDIYNEIPEIRKVSIKEEYVSKMLGIEIKENEIEKILRNYNYEFTKDKNSWNITIPPLRLDLTGAHDMVEEIGRAYGYDKIIPKLPSINLDKKDNPIWTNIYLAKQQLASAGYREVMTYAFTDKGEVEVLASASDKKFLRTNLSDGLKKSYEMNRLNMPLLGTSEIKIFEVGTIFTKKGEEIYVAYIDKKGTKEMTLDEFISFLMKPESEFLRSGRAISKNKESNSEEIRGPKNSDSGEMISFKPWSIYPFITRDIAVWVPEGTTPEMLAKIYKEFGAEILQGEPTLFDQFTKDGRTSYAFHLVFQSFDRTLTDDEVSIIMANISEKIESLGWQIR